MDETLKVLVAIALVAIAVTYVRGWLRLDEIAYRPPVWRVASYFAGLASIAVALLSPIDDLATERFSYHMIQHLLLSMVAAPLLLLGDPLVVLMWGVPARYRRAVSASLTRHGRLRTALTTLTHVAVAGPVYVITMWVWHVPGLYDAAIRWDVVHAVEHMTFFWTAVLFWWPVIEPAPRLRPSTHPGVLIFYLIGATAQNLALGALLSIPERALYPYYAAVATNPVEDQMVAGGLMWGSVHMYLVPILVILYRLSMRDEQEEQPAHG